MKRNHVSRKFAFAVAVCLALLVCALTMEAPAWMRMVLLLAASGVACVWISCESRVDRAAAPINLPPEVGRRVDKPPEGEDE